MRIIQEELQHNIRFQEGYKNFWRDEKCSVPKKESEIQQYIRTIIETPCKTAGVKISREVACANGSIDLNFTYLNFCVCLEIKKADHPDIESAIRNQLVTYMKGEQTDCGIFLVLWYKSPDYVKPLKYESSEDLKKIIIQQIPSEYDIALSIIDCSKPISPSKLKD